MNRSWSTSNGPAGASALVPMRYWPKPIGGTFERRPANSSSLRSISSCGAPPALAAIERGRERPSLHQVHACAPHDEHLPGDVRGGVTREERDHRRDLFRIPLGTAHEVGGTRYRVGHAGQRARAHDVRGDAVLLHLAGEDDRHADDAGLGCRVVDLARLPVEAGLARGVDDPTADRLPGLAPVAPVLHRMVARCHVALQMHGDHGIPLGFGDVEAHRVAQHAGVVDEDVELPEPVDRRGSTSAPAPSHDATSSWFATAVPPPAVISSTTVSAASSRSLTTTLRAFGGEQSRVTASDAATRAGDDRDLAVEQSHPAASLT